MCVLFVFTCIIILAHIEKKITPPRTENKHLIEVGLSVPLIKKTYAKYLPGESCYYFLSDMLFW